MAPFFRESHSQGFVSWWMGVVFLLVLVGLAVFFRSEIQASLLPEYQALVQPLLNALPKLALVLAIALVAKLVLSLLKGALDRYSSLVGKGKEYYTFQTVLRIAVWAIALLVMVSVVVENLGAVVTGLGLIGFGVTFALQKPLLNFVGWLTIIVNKTYAIGDRIEIGAERGDVTDIKLMYTEIKTLLVESDQHSGKIATIPNEMVLSQAVQNYTKDNDFLTNEMRIQVTYESDWERAREILRGIARETVDKYRKEYEGEIQKEKAQISQQMMQSQQKGRRGLQALAEEVRKRKEKISLEQNKMRTGAYEFEPRIYTLAKDSGIEFYLQFVVPYTKRTRTKSELTERFMQAIEMEKKIAIAYPHLHLVYEGEKKRG